MANNPILPSLTRLGVLSAHPTVFLLVIAYTAAWIVVQPETLDWHGAVALITLVMTLFVQRSVQRDTLAIHAKLDELLRAQTDARTDYAALDEKEPEELEAHREEARRRAEAGEPAQPVEKG